MATTRASQAAAKKASTEEIAKKIKALEWAADRNLDSMMYIQNSNIIEKDIRDKQLEAHKSYQGTLFQIIRDYKEELERRAK